jgi:hypothetical protein
MNTSLMRNLVHAASCLLLLAECGCRTADPGPSGHTASGPMAPRTVTTVPPAGHHGSASNDGTYYVAYLPDPDPIPLNQMFSLHVWVYAAADRSEVLPNVRLLADAAMPEHDHGMNTTPRVRANPDGSFTVEGMLFHMPGHWELYLDVARDGITERAQFDVDLH